MHYPEWYKIFNKMYSCGINRANDRLLNSLIESNLDDEMKLNEKSMPKVRKGIRWTVELLHQKGISLGITVAL